MTSLTAAAPDRAPSHPDHPIRLADPEWDPEAVAALRASEYARLDAQDQVYLDYTGAGLYAESQLRASDDLSTFDLGGDGPDHRVAVALAAADSFRVTRQAFDVDIAAGNPRTFRVTDWGSLGPTSLV